MILRRRLLKFCQWATLCVQYGKSYHSLIDGKDDIFYLHAVKDHRTDRRVASTSADVAVELPGAYISLYQSYHLYRLQVKPPSHFRQSYFFFSYRLQEMLANLSGSCITKSRTCITAFIFHDSLRAS
jgi:hypothetical protein